MTLVPGLVRLAFSQDAATIAAVTFDLLIRVGSNLGNGLVFTDFLGEDPPLSFATDPSDETGRGGPSWH